MRESRNKVFTIRLTQMEYEELYQMAEKLKLSIGAYIRMTIFKHQEEEEKNECR